MTRDELQAEYEEEKTLYDNIRTAISALLGKNKRYTYSNIEATHMAETHSLTELNTLKKDTWLNLTSLSTQLSPNFVKLKNYR